MFKFAWSFLKSVLRHFADAAAATLGTWLAARTLSRLPA